MTAAPIVKSLSPGALPETRPLPGRALTCLQIGESWFTERGGGLNRYVAELLAHLPAAGVSSRTLVVGSRQIDEKTLGAVHAVAAENRSLPQRWSALRRTTRAELQAHPPELVVSHFAPYAWPLLGIAGKLPLVVHFHGPWAAESAAEGAGRTAVWLKRRLEQTVYRRAARCIVLSESFKQILCRDYAIDPSVVRVIPGGVDLARFTLEPTRAQARARFSWPIDRPIVLAVRRLVHRMGLENLIDAVRILKLRHPDLLVLIAGTGPLAGLLSERIKSNQLQDQVRLLGFLPEADLPTAYRAADLTIIPSLSLEGFGLVAAESLATGTPPLVTPVGGLPDVVRDLSPALVLAGCEPSQIADRVAELLGSLARLPSAERCRQYATERFDWNAIVHDIARVYREVCN